MRNRTEGGLRFLIADPDPVRRGRIMAHAPAGAAIEAASLSEAFDLAESQRPDAIALCTDISGDAGLDMFLHLVDALSISFVVYGDRARDRTPERLRKSIPFIPFAAGDDPERVLDGFLSEPGHAAPDRPLRDPRATPVASGARAPSLVVLGASTGGVSALETVLTAFPANCPPTLVVQHIRAGFVEGMIKRLDGRCLPRVVPADDALRLQTGHVYIAHDPERHVIVQTGEPARCRLKAQPPRHGHRPSVDALFESVAGRPGVAAALLTGMGADGAEGLARIKSGGGLTIAQNEETCVVYGMPRVAVERGAADHVLPLDRIAAALFGGTVSKGPGSAFPREMAR
jgi:two-component system, chemotaxis family, protein-glutamate methylesterase/glutaminase